MLTDDIIIAAYRKTDSFFSSSIKNKVGSSIIEQMKKDGDKYLVPNYKSKEEILSLTKKWYVR